MLKFGFSEVQNISILPVLVSSCGISSIFATKRPNAREMIHITILSNDICLFVGDLMSVSKFDAKLFNCCDLGRYRRGCRFTHSDRFLPLVFRELPAVDQRDLFVFHV
jgi:hypothetical protein